MQKRVIVLVTLGLFVCLCSAGFSIYEIVAFVKGRMLFEDGYKAMMNRDYKKAITLFDESLKEPTTRAWRAAILADRGWCKHWLGHRKEAIADYTAALQLNPDLFFARENRGYAYDQSGDSSHAADDYEAALRINPKSAPAYAGRSRLYRDEQKYDLAAADLSKAVSLMPKSESYLYARALTYLDEEKYNEVIDDSVTLIALNNHDERAWQLRGVAYRELKKFDRALDDFTTFIKLAKSADAYNDRARTYSKSGQYALALADYEQAQRFKRGRVRTRSRSMAWFLATCPDPKFRDGAKAIEKATKDCEESKWNSASALDALAAAEAEVGNFDEAQCYEDAALQLGESYPRWSRGLSLRRALYEQHQPFRDNMEE